MLIIIEGIDKTGKSTLIEYLVKNLPMAYTLKFGDRPKDNTKEERSKIINASWKIIELYNNHFKDNILILDRFLISELVYASKRGYSAIDKTHLGRQYKDIVKEVESMEDVLLIHCLTDKNLIAKKFVEQSEDYVNVKEIKRLCDKYLHFVGSVNIKNKWIYDYTRVTPAQVARRFQLEFGEKK